VSSSSSSRETALAVSQGVSFELSGEQRELQALAHEFAERELRPVAREWDEREDCPPELLGKAAALGLTSHAIRPSTGAAASPR
jgi:alkylation response protein AidB-like acyl-CoA dehydrogenase